MANRITALRLFLMLGSLGALAGYGNQAAGLAMVVFLFASVLDKVDGVVARRFTCQTIFGRRFDVAADEISIIGHLIALAALGQLNEWLIVLVLVRNQLAQMIWAASDETGVEIKRFPVGHSRYLLQIAAIGAGLGAMAAERNGASTVYVVGLKNASMICIIASVAVGYATLILTVVLNREAIRSMCTAIKATR